MMPPTKPTWEMTDDCFGGISNFTGAEMEKLKSALHRADATCP